MAEPELVRKGVWRVRWTSPAGDRKSKQPFSTKKAALAYGMDKEGEAPGLSSGLTWGQWLPTWLLLRGAAPQTDKDDLWVINKWLLPRWGDVELAAITRQDVKLWIAQTGTQARPPTVRRVLTHLSGSFNHAIEAELVVVNPCYRIRTAPIALGNERFFTVEEFDAIYAKLNEPYASFELGLVETGLRFSELAGLHEQQVDREQKMLDITLTMSGASVEPTKGRNRRGVPLSDRLLAALPEPNTARTCGLVHGGSAARCRSGLVFPSPEGAVLDAKNVLRRHWYPAMDAAGVARGRQHDLRHTFASWMIQAGVSLDRIAELLGHSSAEVTRRYAHLGGAHIEQAREILNRPRPEADSGDNPLSVPFRPKLKIIAGGA